MFPAAGYRTRRPGPAQCLAGDGGRRAEESRARQRRADLAGSQLVLGAAEHDGAAVGRRAGGRIGHGGPHGCLGAGVDRVGQTRAGDRRDPRRAGEVGDELALIGAGRGGHGRPDGDRIAERRGGLDRGDGADDRDAGLELGPQRAEGVHGAGVAGEHEHVGPERRGRPGGRERPRGDVVGRARSPWHAVRVHGQHEVRVGAQPVQLGGGGEQPDPGVDQRDPHAAQPRRLSAPGP